MGKSFEKQTTSQIEMTADALVRAAGHLTTSLQQMQQAGLSDAWIVWSRRHSDAVALIAGTARVAAGMIEEQIVSHGRGESSFYDRQSEKIQRQTEKNREKRAEERDTLQLPPPKRGRPRKAAAKKRPGKR